MARQVISTVEQLRAAFAKHCSGFGEHSAKDVRDVRYELLTPDEIQILNDFYRQNLGEYDLIPTIELLSELLGLEPAGNAVPFIQIGDVAYVATRNKYNRSRTMSRIGPVTKDGTYSRTMVLARWVYNPSDPWVVDVNGQAASLQHRATAMILALQKGAILPPVAINFGLPKQFKDLADKAKARTKIDDSVTDPNVMPESLMRLIELETNGMELPIADREKVRAQAVKLRSTLCGMLGQRLAGKDITTTGAKQSFELEQGIVDRFGLTSVNGLSYGPEESPEYVEGGTYQALDVLVARVLIGTRDRSGLVLFSPAIIATGLALASNRESVIDSKARSIVAETIDDENSTAFGEALIRATQEVLESELEIDWDLVRNFLDYFRATQFLVESSGTIANETGPLGTVFADLLRHNKSAKGKYIAKKLNYAATSISAMSSLVQLLNQLADGVDPSELESITTRYKDSNSKDDNKVYRAFGGVDIGYTAKTRKKDSDE